MRRSLGLLLLSTGCMQFPAPGPLAEPEVATLFTPWGTVIENHGEARAVVADGNLCTSSIQVRSRLEYDVHSERVGMLIDLAATEDDSFDTTNTVALRWKEADGYRQLSHARTRVIEHDGFLTYLEIEGPTCRVVDDYAACAEADALGTARLVVDHAFSVQWRYDGRAGRFEAQDGSALCQVPL